MRKSGWVAVGLVGLAIAGAAAVYERPAEAPSPVAETPPPAPPQPQTTELRGAQPKIESPPAAIPAQRAPAVAAAPDLPTIEVAQRPVHIVPDEDTPAPRVSIFDRSGKEITPRQSASVPRSPPSPPPAAPSLAPFIGNAQAGGGTVLTVAGKNVKLFGVRVADARDRCSLGQGDSRSCGEVARDALAQRLKRNPSVSCRVPAGQQGEPAAVCIDASGTDLSGFLVAEGLALADTSQSYEYFGSEGVARYFGRGLWRYRR